MNGERLKEVVASNASHMVAGHVLEFADDMVKREFGAWICCQGFRHQKQASKMRLAVAFACCACIWLFPLHMITMFSYNVQTTTKLENFLTSKES